MGRFAIIGIAAGAASALMFASASAGGVTGRMLLFFLAPLPTYLAGLGWGYVSAAIAAIVSAAGASLIIGPKTGVVYLVGHGLPAVLLCYLALLSRPVAPMPPAYSAAGTGDREWYPPGRLLAVATLISGALAGMTLLLIGTDLEELRKLVREFLDKVVLKQMPAAGAGKLGESELSALSEMMLYALPAGAAFFWLSGFLANLWLAGKITMISGRLLRPWPRIDLMQFPARFSLGLAASFGAFAVLTGYPALLAAGFAGAFFIAYALMGLAVIHYVTRDLASRTMILMGVYLALFVLNTWAALAIALIGILEPLLPWRRPFAGTHNPPDQ